jgi:hypothetical protein
MKIIIPIAGKSDKFLERFGTIKPLTKVGYTTVIDKFITHLILILSIFLYVD